MTNEDQRTFLINMLKVMIRELIVYKGFVEHLKEGTGSAQAASVDDFLAKMRSDPSVKTQLSPDFEIFVASALQSGENDAALVLRAFVELWTSRSDSN